MLNFQPAFSPSVPPPAQGPKSPFLGQVPLASAVGNLSLLPHRPHYDLGVRHPKLSQTFDQIMGWPPAAGDILRLLFHGGTTWLGITVGSRDRNKWVSGIAWVLAVGNGLAAIADVVSLMKRATGTHPPEPSAPAPSPVPATRSY